MEQKGDQQAPAPNNASPPPADASAAAPATSPPAGNALPKDALEKTNEELAADQAVDATNGSTPAADPNGKPPKGPNAIKKLFRKVDVYLLGVVLLMALVGVFTVVSYLNSKKAPKAPTITAQQLTPGALKSLTNSNVTVDNAAQTLTVQGNAIFAGQVLTRSALDVASNIESGSTISAPNLTITGTANLPGTQINNLQVAKNLVVQGAATLGSLNVAGSSTFNQPITASQITVSDLILSGNGVLDVPDHITFTGPPPTHSDNFSILGSGGTANIDGSDTTGTVNVNTGNGPSAGCFMTITFAQHFTNTPRVMISPVNVGGGESQYYVTETTSGFSVCMNTPPANQAFEFNYFVTD